MILSYRFVFYFSFSLKSGNLSVNLDNLVLDQKNNPNLYWSLFLSPVCLMLYWYCVEKFCLFHSWKFKRGLTIDGQNCSVLIGFNKRITSCERWILKYLFLFTSLFISQHHLFCLFSKTIDHFAPFLIVSKHNCHQNCKSPCLFIAKSLIMVD